MHYQVNISEAPDHTRSDYCIAWGLTEDTAEREADHLRRAEGKSAYVTDDVGVGGIPGPRGVPGHLPGKPPALPSQTWPERRAGSLAETLTTTDEFRELVRLARGRRALIEPGLERLIAQREEAYRVPSPVITDAPEAWEIAERDKIAAVLRDAGIDAYMDGGVLRVEWAS